MMDNSYNTSTSGKSATELKHEKSVIDAKNAYELERQKEEHSHELNIINKQLGWLGCIFGGKELTALNISGALLILLILFGVIFSGYIACSNPITITIGEVWTVITPIITLTLGYIFGNKQS